jgi:hypothetical protein
LASAKEVTTRRNACSRADISGTDAGTPIGGRAAGRVPGQLAVCSLGCGGVILQRLADGPVLVAGRVGGGKGAGVVAEQFVEAVPAAGRFLDQVNLRTGRRDRHPPGRGRGREGGGVDIDAEAVR